MYISLRGVRSIDTQQLFFFVLLQSQSRFARVLFDAHLLGLFQVKTAKIQEVVDAGGAIDDAQKVSTR